MVWQLKKEDLVKFVKTFLIITEKALQKPPQNVYFKTLVRNNKLDKN